METSSTETRECRDCKGQGEHVSPSFTSAEGREYPESRRKCHTCDGARAVPKPNFVAIFDAVTTKRGAAKGKRVFRKSPPELWRQSTQGIANRRAYYVWRWTRFHGGADVTMPMTAELFAGRDAWQPELDAFARYVASKAFGTDRAGSHRWARALGCDVAREAGEPDSAFSGGPVQDGNKPGFEALELK